MIHIPTPNDNYPRVLDIEKYDHELRTLHEPSNSSCKQEEFNTTNFFHENYGSKTFDDVCNFVRNQTFDIVFCRSQFFITTMKLYIQSNTYKYNVLVKYCISKINVNMFEISSVCMKLLASHPFCCEKNPDILCFLVEAFMYSTRVSDFQRVRLINEVIIRLHTLKSDFMFEIFIKYIFQTQNLSYEHKQEVFLYILTLIEDDYRLNNSSNVVYFGRSKKMFWTIVNSDVIISYARLFMESDLEFVKWYKERYIRFYDITTSLTNNNSFIEYMSNDRTTFNKMKNLKRPDTKQEWINYCP